MTCKHAANATRDANFTSWNRSRWVIRLELQTVRTVRLSAWLWGEDEGNNFAVFLFLVDENYKSALGNGPQRRLKLWTCPTSALFTLRLLPLPPDEEGAQSLTFGQWWWCYRPITQRHITRNASPANRWSLAGQLGWRAVVSCAVCWFLSLWKRPPSIWLVEGRQMVRPIKSAMSFYEIAEGNSAVNLREVNQHLYWIIKWRSVDKSEVQTKVLNSTTVLQQWIRMQTVDLWGAVAVKVVFQILRNQ